MTATRIVRAATIAVVAAAWAVAAVVLWRTKVPSVQLPQLDENGVFGRDVVEDARHYESFLNADFLLGLAAGVLVLVLFVRRGPRLARSLRLGNVNAGIVTGVVTIVALWAVSLPFDFAAAWWARRHGISLESYAGIGFELWFGLYGTVFGTVVTLAIVLLLAKRFHDRWWIGFVLIGTALGIALTLVLPYVTQLGTKAPPPRLARDVRKLERREHVSHPTVRVVDVDEDTTAANAQTTGIGPSRSIFFWNTLLDGRFSHGEVRFVAAHELAHLARSHIWKGIGWSVLIGAPALAAAAGIMRRRGGLSDPGVVPYFLLVVTVIGVALAPVENVISRRYETEADWLALQATRDPAAARALFRHFARFVRQDPTPPAWAHVLFDTHPTVLQRIELAEAWGARDRRQR